MAALNQHSFPHLHARVQPIEEQRQDAPQSPNPIPGPLHGPVAGESYKNSETTRLLSAAAYLNRSFREEVVKFCLHNRHCALGSSFGLDMPTVVRHCRRAKKILGRQSFYLFPLALTAGILIPNSFPNPTPAAIGEIGLLYLISFGICLYFETRARAIVTSSFMRGNFNPDAFLEGDATPVADLEAAETGNAVIYSGFSPFVGSGEELGAWSFALDLRKRAEDPVKAGNERSIELSESELNEITLGALYSCVAKNIAELHLERVSVHDKLYVNGRDIRDDQRFLSDPLSKPHYRVTDQVMENAMLEQGEKHLRHYRCIRVVDWNGELVLSIFLRFTRLSHNLFVEASYFLLTPVAEHLRVVDTLSPHFRFGRFIKLAGVTAIKTPFLLIWSLFDLLHRPIKRIQRWSAGREEDRLIRENPSFDYGASFSFRQWASGYLYRRYFQRLDKEMYLKILEKNVLDSILTFLEEHNVDVSELKQRQMTILNQGVIVSGGTMTTHNTSVGAGAKVENVAKKVSNFVSKAAAPPKAE